MDEFAERVSEVPAEVPDVPTVLFADDVLLAASHSHAVLGVMLKAFE